MVDYFNAYVSEYGAVVPRFTAGTSALSSLLILYLILRSGAKLSTIYHRIMFGMSLADVIGSLAMSLTTLPMPAELPLEEKFGYIFAGTRLGNDNTCQAQGFSFLFGTTTAISYYAALCLYYAFALGVMMPEAKIRRRLEPFLHLLPLFFGLYASVSPLHSRLYSPTLFDAWCSIGRYPFQYYLYYDDPSALSTTEDYIIINDPDAEDAAFFIGLIFILVGTSLSAVLWRVFKTERLLNRHVQPLPRADISRIEGGHNYQRAIRTHAATKVIIIQVAGYVCVLACTMFWPFIIFTVEWDIADEMTLMFFPLQGFFNLLIFVLHKLYNHRRIHQSSTYMEILRKIFCGPVLEESDFVLRMSIVERTATATAGANERSIFIVDEQNEFDQHISYVFSTLGSFNDLENENDVVFSDDSGELANIEQGRRPSFIPEEVETRIHQTQSDKEAVSTLSSQYNIAYSSKSDAKSDTFDTGGSQKSQYSAVSISTLNVINTNPLEDHDARYNFDEHGIADHSSLTMDSESQEVFAGTSTNGDLSGFSSGLSSIKWW